METRKTHSQDGSNYPAWWPEQFKRIVMVFPIIGHVTKDNDKPLLLAEWWRVLCMRRVPSRDNIKKAIGELLDTRQDRNPPVPANLLALLPNPHTGTMAGNFAPDHKPDNEPKNNTCEKCGSKYHKTCARCALIEYEKKIAKLDKMRRLEEAEYKRKTEQRANAFKQINERKP